MGLGENLVDLGLRLGLQTHGLQIIESGGNVRLYCLRVIRVQKVKNVRILAILECCPGSLNGIWCATR